MTHTDGSVTFFLDPASMLCEGETARCRVGHQWFASASAAREARANAWEAGMSAVHEKHALARGNHLSHAGTADGAIARHGTSDTAGAGRELLKMEPRWTLGTRNTLALRLKYQGAADATAVDRTIFEDLNRNLSLVEHHSYGTMRMNVSYPPGGTACIIELDITASTANLATNPVEITHASLLRVMPNVPVSCRVSVALADWHHILMYLPSTSSFSWAGVAEIPGPRVAMNGYGGSQIEKGWSTLYHELGHDWGLNVSGLGAVAHHDPRSPDTRHNFTHAHTRIPPQHGNLIHPYTFASIEYGDATECMGGGLYEHVYRGCDFQAGYKHAMHWLSDTRVADLTPASLDPYGATFALGGIERLGITPASQLEYHLGLRTPSPSGMPASWVYVTHRSVSPVASGSMQLNEVTQNWDSLWHDGAGTAAPFKNNSMGHAYLIDTVPYTLDQGDSDVDAGEAGGHAATPPLVAGACSANHRTPCHAHCDRCRHAPMQHKAPMCWSTRWRPTPARDCCCSWSTPHAHLPLRPIPRTRSFMCGPPICSPMASILRAVAVPAMCANRPWRGLVAATLPAHSTCR